LAGGPVQFIGRVGVGAIGAALVTELLDADVDERVQRESRAGTIAELVDADGEKSILPDRGAATELEDIDGVSWLHVPAYSLIIEPLATTTARAIRAVQQTGGTVSSDASSVAIVDEVGASRFSEMLAGLGPDVVLYNQDEDIVLGVTARQGIAGVELTVVKSGANDVVAHREGEIVAMVPPPHLSNVRETTAAGDACAAGFIFARMALGDIATALGQWNQSAAQLLTRHSA
jgi:sugar/nucleoside kinase (ribokinase family)